MQHHDQNLRLYRRILRELTSRSSPGGGGEVGNRIL